MCTTTINRRGNRHRHDNGDRSVAVPCRSLAAALGWACEGRCEREQRAGLVDRERSDDADQRRRRRRRPPVTRSRERRERSEHKREREYQRGGRAANDEEFVHPLRHVLCGGMMADEIDFMSCRRQTRKKSHPPLDEVKHACAIRGVRRGQRAGRPPSLHPCHHLIMVGDMAVSHTLRKTRPHGAALLPPPAPPLPCVTVVMRGWGGGVSLPGN